jgi:putative FmdB family regulatory protein
MPLRDFQCGQCGHEWEGIQRIDEPRPACPHCEDNTKVVLLPALIGGYSGSFGGGSTTPRQAGAFRGKVRTK